MKNIKFRAWDKINEEMIPWGRLLNGYNLRNVFMGPEMCGLILMQYTGLKDKNGVEIYEGDVLYFEPYETHINDRVVQNIDGAYHGRLIRSGYSKLLAECLYETKVIGNIYENPELLEEKK